MSQYNVLYPFELLCKRFFQRFSTRLRYPVCCPEDVAKPLGLCLSNQITFQELVQTFSSPKFNIHTLHKYMRRSDAETYFNNALRAERFKRNTLFSYYFTEGWMEFNLHFDEEGKLRRVYIQHQSIENPAGVEIPLKPIQQESPVYR